MALGARDAHRFEAPIAYGSTLEFTIQLGVGFGVNAIRTVTKPTTIKTPRTKPMPAPNNRSSHASPLHLKNLERSLAIRPPTSMKPKRTTKNPSRLDAAEERMYWWIHAAG